MVNAEQQVEINRPVADVFAFVGTNYFANCPRWSPDCLELQQTSPGPMAVGAAAHEVRNINGKPVELETVVTEYEPTRTMSFRSTAPGRQTDGTYSFEPTSTGTRVRTTLKVEGGFPRLATPLIGRSIQKALNQDMDRLKGLLG